jgi:hypothetical protein
MMSGEVIRFCAAARKKPATNPAMRAVANTRDNTVFFSRDLNGRGKKVRDASREQRHELTMAWQNLQHRKGQCLKLAQQTLF